MVLTAARARAEGMGADPLQSLAEQFAPLLRFDQAAVGFPMSAQRYFDDVVKAPGGARKIVQNTDASSLASGSVPTYFQAHKDAASGQVRIRYWFFYGYQAPCFLGFGSHRGDWENVIVTLSDDARSVAAVTFQQHHGWYTRTRGGFERLGTHPVVYVGRTAHGSFHDAGGAAGGPWQCGYWSDPRKPGPSLDTSTNLVSLTTAQEPWMDADARRAFAHWGQDGCARHPTTEPPSMVRAACSGTTFANNGCMRSAIAGALPTTDAGFAHSTIDRR
jgi:hypothetical protein